MRTLLGFPNPVNENAARTVAAVVLLLSLIVLTTGWLWLLVPLAYGFVARALTGPTLSPLGALAMKVIGPRLGPPKRFAQSIGAVLTVVAAVTGLALGWTTVALALTGVLAVFAFLESAVGFCAGCFAFGRLMRAGIIPPETCEACADIRLRHAG